jgi:hypothetical protein
MVQMVANAAPMDWVLDNISSFAPFDENGPYSAVRTKAFTELAVLVAVRLSVAGAGAQPGIGAAVDLLERAGKRPDFTDWMRRCPLDLVNFAELCAALHAAGRDTAALRRQLQSAVDAGMVDQVERMPHRLVELRCALDWVGIRHSLPSMAFLVERTILSSIPTPALLTKADLYALTHVVLFASRFGLDRGGLPVPMRGERSRSLLSDLLVVTAQAQNWDIFGELLLCWDCVGLAHDTFVDAAWNSFRDAFRPDGAVLPTLDESGDEAVRDSLTPLLNGARTDFDAVYHTTLVAALAEIVAAGRSRFADPDPSARPRRGLSLAERR